MLTLDGEGVWELPSPVLQAKWRTLSYPVFLFSFILGIQTVDWRSAPLLPYAAPQDSCITPLHLLAGFLSPRSLGSFPLEAWKAGSGPTFGPD